MAPGKPPRRTKSTNEPVTIDLEAERSEKVTHDEGTKPEDMTADEPEMASPQGDPVQPAPEPDAAEAETSVEEAPPKEDESPATSDNEAPRATPAHKAPSTSGMVAAGIIGGLIALAGAGALQYGGVLPALGPDRSTPSADSALASQLSSLEKKVADISSEPAQAADTSALDARIAALETELQSVKQNSATGVDNDRVASLEQQVSQTSETIAALQSELSKTTTSLNSAETRLDERLTEAEQKIDKPRTDVEMARAISVTALKSAIERGGPFLAELDTLAGIAPDDPSIEQLKPYAATGIESRAELVRKFPATADAILSAIHQPDTSGGLGERLMASALSVIKVRPVGNIEGESPEAIVARMEDKLRNGDLKGAELEWQNLPEAGKTASADFADALQARVKVEAIVSEALSTAMRGNG